MILPARVTEKPSPISSPVPIAEQDPTTPAVKFDENPPEEFEAVEQMSLAPSTPFPASLFSRSAYVLFSFLVKSSAVTTNISDI